MTASTVQSRTGFHYLSAVAGFVFVALIVVSIVLGGSMPTAEDGAGKIRDYFAHDTSAHKVVVLVGLALVVPFFVFLAGLLRRSRLSDEQHDEGWSTAILASGVFTNVFGSLGVMIYGGLALSPQAGIDGGALRVIWNIQIVSAAMLAAGLVGIGISVGVPVLRHRFWPAWYGWLSLLTAAAGVLAFVSTVKTSAGPFVVPALLASLVWVLASSVLLFRDS